MRHFLRLGRLVLFVLLLVATGCEEDVPEPTEPEGAYRLFFEAVEERDNDELWEYLDKDTKQLFSERYRGLVRVDKIIEAYFDPSEHRYMRERTGTYLLRREKIESARALFDYLVSADAIEFGEDQESGIRIDETVVNEEETEARITNKGGLTLILEKEEDGVWRMASLYSLFDEALAPIAESEAAMREFAKENLIDERDRRLEVIEFFRKRTEQNEDFQLDTTGDDFQEGADEDGEEVSEVDETE